MVGKIKRPETLKHRAQEKIKKLLLAGELKSDEIYSASHFATVLGISRTPAREAMLGLASEGYFVSLPGRGFRVRKLTRKEISDFFETRLVIEGFVVGQMTDRATPGFIQSLEKLLKQMIAFGEDGDESRFIEADKKFHMHFTTAYNNDQFAAIMENIRNMTTLMGRRALTKTGRIQEVIAEHNAIIESLAGKDKDRAVNAIRNHIRATEICVLDHWSNR